MRCFNWRHKNRALQLTAWLDSGADTAGMAGSDRELIELSVRLKAARPSDVVPSEAVRARISNRILRADLGRLAEPDRGSSSRRSSNALGMRPRAMALVSVFLVVAFVAWGAASALVMLPSEGSRVAWAGRLTSVEGRVERRTADASWEQVADGDRLTEGDTLRTASAARAEVELGNGDLFRLNDSSEIRLDSYSEQAVQLTQIAGGSYHRSAYNTNYSITAGELDIRANDTAFSVNEVTGTEEVQVLCLYSDVQVATQQSSGMVSSSLVEGEKCTMTQNPGAGLQLQVDSMNAQDLDDDWLRWNRDRDVAHDLQLGVLARLPLGGLPSGEEPVRGAGDQTGSATPGQAVIPDASQSITFNGAGTADGIQLTWQVKGYDTVSGFQIYRSGSDPADAATFTLEDPYSDGYLDISALLDRQYGYQLALCEGDTVLALSEVVNVSGIEAVPVPQLLLDISPRLGGVMIGGSLSGVTDFTSYVLIRSTSRSNPSYPLEAGETAIQFITTEAAIEYWDGQLVAGQTYYYRLLLCLGDQIILRSDAVSVDVPVLSAYGD